MSVEEEIAALGRMVQFEEGEEILDYVFGDVWGPGLDNRTGILYLTALRVGVSAAGSFLTNDAQAFGAVEDISSVGCGLVDVEGEQRVDVDVHFLRGTILSLRRHPSALEEASALAQRIQVAVNRVIRSDCQQEWERLGELREKDETSRLRAGLDSLLTRFPCAIPALIDAALCDHAAGDAAGAIQLFRRALEAGASQVHGIYTEIAECSLDIADWSAALEAATQALEIEQGASALKYRGVARVETGDLDRGLADIRASAALKPEDDGAWWVLGFYGRKLEDVEAVEQAIERLKALEDGNKARDFAPWLHHRKGATSAAIRAAEESFRAGYFGQTMVMDYLSIVIDHSPQRPLPWLDHMDKVLGDDLDYRRASALACFAAEAIPLACVRARGLDMSDTSQAVLTDLIEGTSQINTGHPQAAVDRLLPWADRDDWSADGEWLVELHQYVCVMTAAAASKVGDLELTERMLRRSEQGAPIDITWIAARQKSLADWTKQTRAADARATPGEKQPPYAILERLVTELRASPRLAEFAERLDEQRRGFDEPPLVAVMGEYSVGKSTFINALLGKRLLPTGDGVTTGTITILRYGEQERMRAVFKDGRVVEREGLASVAEFVQETGAGGAAANLPRHVDVFLRADVLRTISIVDSPGLNAPFAGHKEITKGYLARADAIVWLFNVENAGKSSEADFLALLANHRRKAVAVINQIDLVPRADAAVVVAEVKRDFADTFAHAVGVSAYRALEAGEKRDPALREKSGFPQLQAILDEDLLKAARTIKGESALRKATEILADLANAREQYDQQTQTTMSAVTKLRETARRSAESELASTRQKAATMLRFGIANVLRDAAEALAKRSVNDEIASAAAAETIARALVAKTEQNWRNFVAALHTSYDLIRNSVLDSCSDLANEDLSASLNVALAERRAELASWRKDLADDVQTVDGFLEGYLAAGGLRWAHLEVPEGSRADAAAIQKVLTTNFDFLNTRVVDATNRWTAAVHAGLSESLLRLERELRKTALDLRAQSFGNVERTAASLGLTAAGAAA